MLGKFISLFKLKDIEKPLMITLLKIMHLLIYNFQSLYNCYKESNQKNLTIADDQILKRFNINIFFWIRNHSINEMVKIQKKEVVISQRKNNTIKTDKKPLKISYETYSISTTKEGINKIPVTKRSGNAGVNLKTKINGSKNENTTVTKTKTTRIRSERNGEKKKAEETVAKTTIQKRK